MDHPGGRHYLFFTNKFGAYSGVESIIYYALYCGMKGCMRLSIINMECSLVHSGLNNQIDLSTTWGLHQIELSTKGQ